MTMSKSKQRRVTAQAEASEPDFRKVLEGQLLNTREQLACLVESQAAEQERLDRKIRLIEEILEELE